MPEIRVNLHPINFVIISGILQSMIVGVILILSRYGNRQANKLMGAFVCICSLHFVWSLMIDLNLPDIYHQIFWIPYSFLLAIGPLLFFYTLSLSDPGFRFDKKVVVHFIPVVLELAVQVYFIRKGISVNKVYYILPGFLVFRIFEFGAVAISIVCYGKLSLAVIRKHEVGLTHNFSNQKDITLSWLFRLIKYLRVLWIFWLIFELAFVFFLKFQMHFLGFYLLLYVLLGIIAYSTYWIGVKSLQKSDVLVEHQRNSVPPETTNVYARISEDEVKRHINQLHEVMNTEKLYLHETLTLRMLALRLKADPNLVSYLLNNVLKKSFYDYVNELRIEEVKRKIEDPAFAHIKIAEIGFECGFNSKATFNRVFKKYTGQSPSAYKKIST